MVVDEAKLALLLARDELHQLVNAYCRAVDRADYDALRNLYHPEATDSHGSFSTGGVNSSSHSSWRRNRMCVSPNTTSPQRTSPSRHTARGEIYCLVFHTFAGPEHDIDVIIGGRYLDTYSSTRPLEIQSTHHRGGLGISKRPVGRELRPPQHPRKPARQTRPNRPLDRLIHTAERLTRLDTKSTVGQRLTALATKLPMVPCCALRP